MPAQQGQSQTDDSLSMLWVVIAIVVILVIAWFVPATHHLIVATFFQIKLLEAAVIGLFTNGLNVLVQQIHNTPPAATSLDQMYYVAVTIGKYMSIPVAVLLIVFAVIVYRHNIGSRYRATFSMKRLLNQEKENWPQITPVAQLDLLNDEINKGPWAMSITPMDFAKKYKLLKIEKKASKKTGLSKDMQLIPSIISERAARVFIRQVGRPWSKPENLPIHARALFVIFGLKAHGDSEEADQLLRRIGGSAESGKPNFSGIDKRVPKVKQFKVVQKVMANHAYELTIMASMLSIARLDGVIASAEFLWLKPVDRSLWYMLNTVGRETVVPEIAGAYAHWLAEQEIGTKITVPMVRQAVLALGVAIDELIYTPDEDEEVA